MSDIVSPMVDRVMRRFKLALDRRLMQDAEIERLRTHTTSQGLEITALKSENERLRADLKGRDAVCDSYADENQRFHDEIERLRAVEADIERMREVLAASDAEVERLRAEKAELLAALRDATSYLKAALAVIAKAET